MHQPIITRLIGALALGLAAPLLIAATPGLGPWAKTHETDDGIEIYNRDVPNSKIREVKAIALVKSPPERIREVILDLPHYPEFMPYVEEPRVLKRVNASTTVNYEIINPPLVSRRDCVFRFEEYKDPATNFYQMSWDMVEDPAAPPPIEKVIRLTITKGSWTLEPQNDGSTRVTYWLYSDPGGSIPAWIANKANTSSLPDLMTAIRQRSANPAWKRP